MQGAGERSATESARDTAGTAGGGTEQYGWSLLLDQTFYPDSRDVLRSITVPSSLCYHIVSLCRY